jgi:RHS repeat-associated protein
MGYNDGTTVQQVDKTSMKFTGKERDAETGLDYFGARYYGGAQGRFTSPDPEIIPKDLTNPQVWIIMVDQAGIQHHEGESQWGGTRLLL